MGWWGLTGLDDLTRAFHPVVGCQLEQWGDLALCFYDPEVYPQLVHIRASGYQKESRSTHRLLRPMLQNGLLLPRLHSVGQTKSQDQSRFKK